MATSLPFAFYGDDFTGSTDALEWLARAGGRAVLFLDPPTPETLERFGEFDAIGVAGLTRSLPPQRMQPVLDSAFAALRSLNPRQVHYKVCSTFDSSPRIGSIGCALEAGIAAFGTPLVPIVVAAPALGRHCVFGNLFARMGIGSEGAIHRLDRHPAMHQHPVTPADESDLRLHLARQTELPCALLDILQLQQPPAEIHKLLDCALNEGARAVLVDGLHESDLEAIGGVLEDLTERQSPLFIIGSSGVEMALAGQLGSGDPTPPPATPADGPVLVLSGSCSPVTGAQIEHALAAGFAEVALDPVALLREDPGEVAKAMARAGELLAQGSSVVVHTSRGPGDPRQDLVGEHLGGMGKSGAAAITGELLGRALGRIGREVLAGSDIRRLMIAGGDSSSHAARALGIEAVEMTATFTPGAPLCRIHAPDSPAAGREIVFKGGQVGAADLFPRLLRGCPNS